MNTRIYLRASTKDQDAERALAELNALNNSLEGTVANRDLSR